MTTLAISIYHHFPPDTGICDVCNKPMPCLPDNPILAAGGIETYACCKCRGGGWCDECAIECPTCHGTGETVSDCARFGPGVTETCRQCNGDKHVMPPAPAQTGPHVDSR